MIGFLDRLQSDLTVWGRVSKSTHSLNIAWTCSTALQVTSCISLQWRWCMASAAAALTGVGIFNVGEGAAQDRL